MLIARQNVGAVHEVNFTVLTGSLVGLREWKVHHYDNKRGSYALAVAKRLNESQFLLEQ